MRAGESWIPAVDPHKPAGVSRSVHRSFDSSPGEGRGSLTQDSARPASWKVPRRLPVGLDNGLSST